MIESFDNSKSKKMFKSFLCSFLIVIDIEIVNMIMIVDMITIVDMIKSVFCDEMLVIINDSLSLLI